MTCKLIHEKCEKKAAEDKSLPRSSYLVTYLVEDKISYDIVMAGSRVEGFDEYWDKYKENLKTIGWTHGQVKPHLWNIPQGKKVTKKRKREKENE